MRIVLPARRIIDQILLLLIQLLSTSSVTAAGFSDHLFKKMVVDQHNLLRTLHGSPPLMRDPQLERSAQAWADYLSRFPKYNTCIFHSTRGGENIYYSWSSWRNADEKWLSEDVNIAFYEEILSYDFRRPGFSYTTAHFTQMVWRDTRRIGVGVARLKTKRNHFGCGLKGKHDASVNFVVLHYDPKGNVASEEKFHHNVKRPYRSDFATLIKKFR